MIYTEPEQWQFGHAAPRSCSTFWQCPTRLASEGFGLRMLWRAKGTTRGGGTITSLLPVLAMHVFPTAAELPLKPRALRWREIVPFDPDPADYTAARVLPMRRLAALAGIDKGSVSPAMNALAEVGLAMLADGPRGRNGGPPRLHYRLLRHGLYPKHGERYAEIPSNLLYGGCWSLLTPAARHLYLVLSCLDPVKSESGLVDYADAAGEDADEMIAEMRARSAVSLDELSGRSGLSRDAVRDALSMLTSSVAGPRRPTVALVQRGRGGSNEAFWYRVNRDVAQSVSFPADQLNLRSERKALQRRLWGQTRSGSMLYATSHPHRTPRS